MASDKKNNTVYYLLSGAVAGVVSRTSTAPLDRARVLLQTQTTTSSTLFQGVKQIYKQDGVKGYYIGNGINLMKALPESALRFYIFETLKGMVANYTGKTKNELGAVDKFWAGAGAGALGTVAVYPLEVLKTGIQVSQAKTSALQVARDVYAKGGGGAFFKGLGASLLGIIPYGGLDFALYETLKSKVGSKSDVANLCCGIVSSTVSTSSVYPLHLIRTRLQAQSRLDMGEKYNGLVDAFKKTYKSEGLRGFYKGLVPNIMKVAPAAGITYGVYERMKKICDL